MSDEISIEEKARRYDMIKAEYERWMESEAEADDEPNGWGFLYQRMEPMIEGWTQDEADEHLKVWLS